MWALTVAVVHVEVDDGDAGDALVAVHGAGVGGGHGHVVDQAEPVTALAWVIRHYTTRPGVMALKHTQEEADEHTRGTSRSSGWHRSRR